MKVVHALPGQVRMKLDCLKHNRTLAEALQRALPEIAGITQVEVSEAIGSVLILIVLSEEGLSWQRNR